MAGLPSEMCMGNPQVGPLTRILLLSMLYIDQADSNFVDFLLDLIS